MCGLTALAGDVPADVAAAAIRYAAARGPHSHGWATFADGRWHVERHAGRLAGSPPDRPTVGHSRLATSGRAPGDAPPVEEAQPFADGAHLVAHNGTLPVDVARRFVDAHAVDSLALLRALTAGEQPWEVMAACTAPQALIYARPTVDGVRLVAYRRDGVDVAAHPLYLAQGDGWAACASGPIPDGKLVPANIDVEVWAWGS